MADLVAGGLSATHWGLNLLFCYWDQLQSISEWLAPNHDWNLVHVMPVP